MAERSSQTVNFQWCPEIMIAMPRRMAKLPEPLGAKHEQWRGPVIPVLAGHVVPGVQERSKCSERAEQCSEHSWACSGHVAKISMLRFNIGSGKLRLMHARGSPRLP